MSVKVMALVWDAQGLTSSEKLVLLAYADHASHDGTGIWPAVETIAFKTSLHRRTVQRTTRILEEKGYMLQDGNHDSGTNMWKIPLDIGGDTTPPPGRHSDTGGVTLTTRRGDTTPPEPSLTVNQPSLNKNGVGFYIFNLLGFDYAEAKDKKIEAAILQKVAKHGEVKLCQAADRIIGDYPDIDLWKMMSKLDHYASFYTYDEVSI